MYAASCVEPLESRTLLAAGELDPSFGAGGVALDVGFSLPPSGVESMTIDPQGRIILGSHSAGKIYLERYLPNGSPDVSFNGSGYLTIPAGPDLLDYAWLNLRAFPDGRIDFAADAIIGRILPYGALDPS